MMRVPPAGVRTTRPTLDDVRDIHELVSVCDVAALGRVDTTVEDIRDQLAEPAFQPELDGWLVWQGAALVGWAWTCRTGETDKVDVDVYVRSAADDESLTTWLWETVEERACEIATSLGHVRALVDVGVHRQDNAKSSAVQQRDYAVTTSFYRMRIDHTETPEQVEPPPGVTLVTAGFDDELRRQAHQVHDAAFVGHYGFVAKTYEQWVADKESQSTFDWSQLRLALVDGVPAAMLAGTNQFVADENCGYVQSLGTLHPYRGRGLASLLLRDRFAGDAGLGRVGTYLHVDANNSTGALALYESVGMRTAMVIDVWRKSVDIVSMTDSSR